MDVFALLSIWNICQLPIGLLILTKCIDYLERDDI